MGTSPKENIMPDKVEIMGVGAPEKPDASATMTAEQIYKESLETAKNRGVIEELGRVKRILEVNDWLKLDPAFAKEHISKGTSAEIFQTLALDEHSKLGERYGPKGPGHATLTYDEHDKRRSAMITALTGMLNPKERKEDKDNPFIGLSIKQIAEESVRQEHGFRTTLAMNKVVELAMQTTSDFSNVLENVARKQLLAAYQYAEPTYRMWCKPSTSPDFKTMSRVRLSETPSFVVVPEGAQITIGKMSDSKESYSLATYGRGICFSMQMLINDDLGAFNDLITQFGIQAARLENKTIYAILYANANMADNNPLFDNTYHKNTGTGALGNTAFDLMFATMAKQTGLDGLTVLNLIPKFLIVPKAKEGTAITTLIPTGPNLAATSQNIYSGRLQIVADAELDTNGSGTTKWYAAADPAFAPGIEYCHLQGQEGIQLIRKDNEQGILGLTFYAYLHFAAKAVDWRPLYYSTGA